MYRIGLLLGTETLPAWFARALERAAERPETKIGPIVLVSPPSVKKNTNASGMPGVLNWVYKCKTALRGEAQKRRHISDITALNESRRIECDGIPVGDVGIALPDDVVEDVTESTDVCIHMGVGILKGDILQAPADGVLSYHHGDIREYRGSSAGFWEFLNGEDEMGVTLQQLTETLDGGKIVVLERFDISELHTLNDIRGRARDISADMLVEGLNRLEDPEFSPSEPETLGRVYYGSERRQYSVALLFQAKNFLSRLRKALPR